MATSIVVICVYSTEFMLNAPEQPTQEMPKRDPEEPGNINTNAYVVVRYYKGNHRMSGYPVSILFILISPWKYYKIGKSIISSG